MSQINVGHYGWPTEKILGFEWSRTTQLAVKFLRFFRNIFKYVHRFSCLLKQFLRILFFLQGYFFIKIQKSKKGSVQNETIYILYKLNFLQSSSDCRNLFNKCLIYAAPNFTHLIGNINQYKYMEST